MTDLAASGAFALGAGVATFFAPCAYALLPGYVGYYVQATEGESPPLSGVLLRGLAAGVGAFAATLVLAALALAASDLVEGALPALEVLVGVGLVALGLATLAGRTGGLHVALPERRSGVAAFGAFGAVYAAAAAACVLPLFLSIVLQALALSPSATATVVGLYGGSVAALLVATTVAIGVGRDALLARVGGRSGAVVRGAGVLLVLAGVGQLAVATGVI